MNKNEYLSRVFEGQISYLKREITNYEEEINDLTVALEQAKLNLVDTRETLKYAEDEMRKV